MLRHNGKAGECERCRFMRRVHDPDGINRFRRNERTCVAEARGGSDVFVEDSPLLRGEFLGVAQLRFPFFRNEGKGFPPIKILGVEDCPDADRPGKRAAASFVDTNLPLPALILPNKLNTE